MAKNVTTCSDSVLNNPILQVQGLSTRLRTEAGWVHALEDLALSVSAGKTFALVGESGSGKSMTALSIARLLPDNGAVVAGQVNLWQNKGQLNQAQFDSTQQDLLRLPESLMRAVRGRRVGMIFQEPGTSLNPVMTIAQQLLEVINTHQPRPRVEALKLAEHWLEQVGLGPERLQQYPFQLSGGQKQRVMIAIALAAQPDLLIADEPTTALDVSVQAQVLTLLKTLQQRHGMAILLITHDLGVVAQVADHVALMYAGQVVESASTSDFFAHPRHPYAAALLAALPERAGRHQPLQALSGQVPSLIHVPKVCRFASRCHQAQSICHQTAPELLAYTPEHHVRCFFPLTTPVESFAQDTNLESSENGDDCKVDLNQDGVASDNYFSSVSTALLEVSGLTVAYCNSGSWFQRKLTPVVQGVDFSLQSGKTLAIVGESGSGKSTIAKALLRLLDATAEVGGDVFLNKHDVFGAFGVSLRQIRRNMQVVFQDPFASLNPRQRIVDILLEGITQLCPEVSTDAARLRAQQVLEEVGLPISALQRFAHEFSGGQRQRIAIARALVVQPKLLVLDEPTSALDVSVQAQVLNLLKSLQDKYQMAFLLITHNLSVVRCMADDVLVMRQGRVVEMGPACDVLRQPQSDYTRELLAAVPRLSQF